MSTFICGCDIVTRPCCIKWLVYVWRSWLRCISRCPRPRFAKRSFQTPGSDFVHILHTRDERSPQVSVKASNFIAKYGVDIEQLTQRKYVCKRISVPFAQDSRY